MMSRLRSLIAFRRESQLLACFALAACLIAGSASADPARAAGKDAPGAVSFTRNATPPFTPWLEPANRHAPTRRWMHAHYDEMRGYAPYFTHQTFHDNPPWRPPPPQLYTDAFIMRMSDPAKFRLKDAAGNPCSSTSSCPLGCPAYAGDIGNPAYRAWWIANVEADLDDGYRSIYVDDVNMELRPFEDANGAPAQAIDPRTGQPMTEVAARRYAAGFIEAVNAGLPGYRVIANNNQWWVGNDAEGYHRRAIRGADVTELERGYSVETAGGTGTFGYEAKLLHVDWIHSLGSSVLLEPYLIQPGSSAADQRALAELELASYFLTKRRGDSIASDWRADPGNWWPGWGVDLGRPDGPWYPWHGLFRRDFLGGLALVNQPQEPTRTANLPGGSVWENIEGDRVQSVTLAARRGSVLLRRMPTRVRRLRCARRDSGRGVRIKGVVVDGAGDALTAARQGLVEVTVKPGAAGRSARNTKIHNAGSFSVGLRLAGRRARPRARSLPRQRSLPALRGQGKACSCDSPAQPARLRCRPPRARSRAAVGTGASRARGS